MGVNINQTIIQRVENGFIVTMQCKGQESLFGGPQKDKLHYVCTSEENLISFLKEHLHDLKTDSQILNEQQKLGAEEDDEDIEEKIGDETKNGRED